MTFNTDLIESSEVIQQMLPGRVDYRITFELMIWNFQWKKTQHENISDIGNIKKEIMYE